MSNDIPKFDQTIPDDPKFSIKEMKDESSKNKDLAENETKED
jgi:hypothetical protein